MCGPGHGAQLVLVGHTFCALCIDELLCHVLSNLEQQGDHVPGVSDPSSFLLAPSLANGAACYSPHLSLCVRDRLRQQQLASLQELLQAEYEAVQGTPLQVRNSFELVL